MVHGTIAGHVYRRGHLARSIPSSTCLASRLISVLCLGCSSQLYCLRSHEKANQRKKTLCCFFGRAQERNCARRTSQLHVFESNDVMHCFLRKSCPSRHRSLPQPKVAFVHVPSRFRSHASRYTSGVLTRFPVNSTGNQMFEAFAGDAAESEQEASAASCSSHTVWRS